MRSFASSSSRADIFAMAAGSVNGDAACIVEC